VSEVYNYLASRIPLKFASHPRDMRSDFIAQFEAKRTGTVMPPSPGVDLYLLHWIQEEDGTVNYEVKVEWRSFVHHLERILPKDQISHRSRLVAFAVSNLRVNELNHRIEQVTQFRHELDRVALSPTKSARIYDRMLAIYDKYLVDDLEVFEKYTRARPRSSMGGGHRWREASQLSRAEISSLYDLVKANIANLRRNPGTYTQIRYNTGLRARSQELDRVSTNYRATVERTRTIFFSNEVSSWNAFVKDKPQMFHEVLEMVIQEVGAQAYYIFPAEIGGQVYVEASERFNEGLPFKAFDGKSWESCVGRILGPAFTPLMFHVSGFDMLGSGTAYTSLVDTMAAVVATRTATGDIISLGDDINQLGHGAYMPKYPFIEYQPMDTRMKFILGQSFRDDPLTPRITGLKATTDRSTEMIAVPVDREDRFKVVSKRRDDRQRATWGGLFLGRFGDTTLINRLKKIKPADFKGPSEMFEDLIDKEENIDAFAWAEELGIKDVVVRG